MRTAAFEAIGTHWTIEVDTDLSSAGWQKVLTALLARIDQFDAAYSRFREDSLVTKISRQAGTFELPADAAPLVQFYHDLYRITDGSITPLIGKTVSDAGYDADYSFQPKQLAEPPTWDAIIEYDAQHITLRQPALLDFGAAGKGYLVDIVSTMLRQAGIKTFLVNAGSDIIRRTDDDSHIEIGLENPLDSSEALGIVHLGSQSLCASATNKRQWSQYNHMINPHTLQSPTDIIATWVIADSTMIADGLASALFFTAPAKLRKHYNFAYAFLTKDMSMHHSSNFPVLVFNEA